MTHDEPDEQELHWSLLHDRISETLRQFGTEDHFGKGDYLLVDDNYGQRRHQVEIHRLKILEPRVIKALQAALRDSPGWEIVVAVDIPGLKANGLRWGCASNPEQLSMTCSAVIFRLNFRMLDMTELTLRDCGYRMVDRAIQALFGHGNGLPSFPAVSITQLR